MTSSTRELAVLAMLIALAYLAVFSIRIPVMPALPFLKFEPKDVVIVIGGFLYGPLAAFAIAVSVAFTEMVTISETAWIGFLMNVISSCAFACPAAFIYKRKRSLSGAVIGLASGCVLMTAVMLLWNYIVTPIYMGIPRAAVTAMLIPGFLPFNLIKSVLNAAIAMLIYKPVSAALRAAKLYQASANTAGTARRFNIGVTLISAFIILSVALVILAIQGVF